MEFLCLRLVEGAPSVCALGQFLTGDKLLPLVSLLDLELKICQGGIRKTDKRYVFHRIHVSHSTNNTISNQASMITWLLKA